MKDWTWNASMRVCNSRSKDAEPNDYYATEPRATELLLETEDFCHNVWEPACGEGHISKVLADHGYAVHSTDLIDRGFGIPGVDFLKLTKPVAHTDIVTHPPYKYAKEFVEQALNLVEDGRKVAMFLTLPFLESSRRKQFFQNYPPKTVYVSPARLNCVKNGDFSRSNMVAYAWFIWEKGYKGDMVLKWIN